VHDLLARLAFAIVDLAARKGLAVAEPDTKVRDSAKNLARRVGIHGETYAYWYLRRMGYVMVARNYTHPGVKGEIDIVGYDRDVLAFIEVKTRSISSLGNATGDPENAVDGEKRRNLERMARQFALSRHVPANSYRFDILAIVTGAGTRPTVRLHKGAFLPTNRRTAFD
jgi:putative endonuclease